MQFKLVWRCYLVVICLFLSACMPAIHPLGAKIQAAQLTANAYITADGVHLPLRSWLPQAEVKAIIVGLHGFNDYSRFLEKPARYFSEHGMACFAYDQRGFGSAPKRGLWAGRETYVDDLISLVKVLKQRYQGRPVYLLGESMGGAIVIATLRQLSAADVAGAILLAPAVWSRASMPWYQTSLLWTLAHTVPWLTLTGRGLKRQASDNIAMLQELGRDPLVIKETRVEAMYGLTDLMDEAYTGASSLQANTLLMYGEKDEIIPKEPTYQVIKEFLAAPSQASKTVGIYAEGYHMLLRDLGALSVWQDIVAWIGEHPVNLPSGAHQRAQQILDEHRW